MGMKMRRIIQSTNEILKPICLGLFLIIGITSIANAFDYQRAQQNYVSVVTGKKQFKSLSQEEQTEVRIFAQMLKSKPPDGASSDCQDAWEEANSTADDLTGYAKKLKRCAESKDFDDDCSREFRRVKSSYSDYEDAVSSVQSECD
jgi:hypothetical protein